MTRQKNDNWIINPEEDSLLIAGMDEAGRGPVIGPMVIAGVSIKGKNLDRLIDIGVNDSKKISSEKREKIYPDILSIIKKCKIEIIQPSEIDRAIMGPNSSLNTLEAKYFLKIIKFLSPAKMYIDSPGNPKSFKNYISHFNKTKTEIIAENKADTKYPAVAAASVLAKVIRDRLIEDLHKTYGDFGTGYPSPKTNKFMQENYLKCPEIFRQSYKNYRALLSDKDMENRLLD